MLRVLIISVLILNTSGKLFFKKRFRDDNNVDSPIVKPRIVVESINNGTPLWVLSLSGDDWLAPKLRLGNTTELESFFHYVGPFVKNSRNQRPTLRVKKDDPERTTSIPPHKSNAEIRNDFIKMINKFALSTNVEPDAYVTDNNYDYNNPAVTLFFKEPYASLVVKLGSRLWHYYLGETSTLSWWFHEVHDTCDSPILLSEDVQRKLFSSLWRLLHIMFALPM